MRAKLYYLNERDLIYYLMRGDRLPGAIIVPTPSNLPLGAQVRHVFHDPSRRQFGVWVEHDSFPELHEGEIPPESDTRLQMKQVMFQVVSDRFIPEWEYLTDETLKAMLEAIKEEIYDRQQKGIGGRL